MNIDIITLFPEILQSPFSVSILKKAIKSKIVSINFHDLREYGIKKQKQVDDYPFGGGSGNFGEGMALPWSLDSSISIGYSSDRQAIGIFLSAPDSHSR